MCLAGSIVGSATAPTPEDRSALTVPGVLRVAWWEAFRQLIVVLQGHRRDGRSSWVSKSISKSGVTSSTFNHVPDVPITSFDLKDRRTRIRARSEPSARRLTGFCGQKLTMPTEFTGQNGAYIKQKTPIAITGCAKTIKHKTKKHTQPKHKKHNKHK